MSALSGRPPAPRATRPSRLTRALTIVAVALFALLVVLAAAVWIVGGRASADVVSGEPVQVVVPGGASTAKIAEVLSSAGVIGEPLLFRIQARLSGADGELKPGTYDLTTGMSFSEALAALTEGPQTVYVTVTIPEGYVVDQIAARFEEQAGVSAKEFIALAKGQAASFAADHPYLKNAYDGSLEGYLFPKTYEVPQGAVARDVIEMMLDQFDLEFAKLDLACAHKKGLSDAHVVVLASMIEREAKLAKERPLVSSVIYNRLARGMKLEIDATIAYVLPGNKFRLTARDIRIDSPYNTYRNAGLPPGPISNPGLASLQAAAQPASTEYLYYVLTGKDGSHTFCRTKAEFLVAKARSKEVFGQ